MRSTTTVPLTERVARGFGLSVQVEALFVARTDDIFGHTTARLRLSTGVAEEEVRASSIVVACAGRGLAGGSTLSDPVLYGLPKVSNPGGNDPVRVIVPFGGKTPLVHRLRCPDGGDAGLWLLLRSLDGPNGAIAAPPGEDGDVLEFWGSALRLPVSLAELSDVAVGTYDKSQPQLKTLCTRAAKLLVRGKVRQDPWPCLFTVPSEDISKRRVAEVSVFPVAEQQSRRRTNEAPTPGYTGPAYDFDNPTAAGVEVVSPSGVSVYIVVYKAHFADAAQTAADLADALGLRA